MSIIIDHDGDASHALICAHCRNTFVHHTAVDIHARPAGEDSPTYSHRAYDRPRLTFPNPRIHENPSTRRDAVSVVYECEGCGQHSRLMVEQHKGKTYLGTEKLFPVPMPPGAERALDARSQGPKPITPPPLPKPPTAPFAPPPPAPDMRFEADAEFWIGLRALIMTSLMKNPDNHKVSVGSLLDQVGGVALETVDMYVRRNWATKPRRPV